MSNVIESSVEQCLLTYSKAARTLLSDTCSHNESLSAASIVGLKPSYEGSSPSDGREVARINPPSDVSLSMKQRMMVTMKLELDEISVDECHQAMKAGDLSDMVIL